MLDLISFLSCVIRSTRHRNNMARVIQSNCMTCLHKPISATGRSIKAELKTMITLMMEPEKQWAP